MNGGEGEYLVHVTALWSFNLASINCLMLTYDILKATVK
jgi:hypothetical protein